MPVFAALLKLLTVLTPRAQEMHNVPGARRSIEVELDVPSLLAKFGLILAAGLIGAGLLPWLLRRAKSPALRAFRTGAIYALGPAVVAGAGAGSVLSGVSLEMLRNAPLERVWPLPLLIFALVIAGEILGGLLAMLLDRSDEQSGEGARV